MVQQDQAGSKYEGHEPGMPAYLFAAVLGFGLGYAIAIWLMPDRTPWVIATVVSCGGVYGVFGLESLFECAFVFALYAIITALKPDGVSPTLDDLFQSVVAFFGGSLLGPVINRKF